MIMKRIKRWFNWLRSKKHFSMHMFDYCNIPEDSGVTMKDFESFCKHEPSTLEELAYFIVPKQGIIRLNTFDYNNLLLSNEIEKFSRLFEQYSKEYYEKINKTKC